MGDCTLRGDMEGTEPRGVAHTRAHTHTPFTPQVPTNPSAYTCTHTPLHTRTDGHVPVCTRAGYLLRSSSGGASWAPRTWQREPRCQWLLSSWPGSAKLLAGRWAPPTMPRNALWPELPLSKDIYRNVDTSLPPLLFLSFLSQFFLVSEVC